VDGMATDLTVEPALSRTTQANATSL
jgi:hypothetical protein